MRRIGRGPGEASHQFRTELLGQQASKQIRLFIRCLSTDDAGNGTSAMLLFHPPQRINHPAERLLPGRRGEIRRPAYERAEEAALCLQLLVPEPAFITHPVLIHVWIGTRTEAIHLTMTMVDVDVATGSAAGTDGLNLLQVPDPRLKAEVFTGQRAHWADIDHIARVQVIEPLAWKQVNVAMIATGKDAQLAGLGDLVEEPSAAGTEDATLLIENHLRPEIHDLALFDFGFKREPAAVDAVVHVVVLQLALTGLVADRAVDRVIDQQELQHRGLGGLDLGTGRPYHHPLSHPGVTGDL